MNTQHDHTNPTTTLTLILAALIFGTPQLGITSTTPAPSTACPAPGQTTMGPPNSRTDQPIPREDDQMPTDEIPECEPTSPDEECGECAGCTERDEQGRALELEKGSTRHPDELYG